jgi:hypothetical protein
MKLVYEADGQEVKIGDQVRTHGGMKATVQGITKPHKPSSTGRVHIVEALEDCKDLFYPDQPATETFYPGVIGAKWIDREDQTLFISIP